MTYIISLTPEQFALLHDLVHSTIHTNSGWNNNTLQSILHALDDAEAHYNERQAVLRDLLGISILNPHH